MIGLLLTPVGAWIGTALFFSVIILLSNGTTFNSGHILGMATIGLLMGSIFAAPVTAFGLPAIYGVLRRRSALTAARLIVSGATFGFVSVLVLVLVLWARDDSESDWRFWTLTLGMSADGAIAGTACAWLFGRIMRRLRPADWRSHAGLQA